MAVVRFVRGGEVLAQVGRHPARPTAHRVEVRDHRLDLVQPPPHRGLDRREARRIFDEGDLEVHHRLVAGLRLGQRVEPIDAARGVAPHADDRVDAPGRAQVERREQVHQRVEDEGLVLDAGLDDRATQGIAVGLLGGVEHPDEDLVGLPDSDESIQVAPLGEHRVEPPLQQIDLVAATEEALGEASPELVDLAVSTPIETFEEALNGGA